VLCVDETALPYVVELSGQVVLKRRIQQILGKNDAYEVKRSVESAAKRIEGEIVIRKMNKTEIGRL
jgi:hypothetical protein